MRLGGPSEDPVEDIGRSDEYDREVYIINGTLHGMITAADQAPGVVVEARDEEEEEEAAGGGGGGGGGGLSICTKQSAAVVLNPIEISLSKLRYRNSHSS